MDFEERLQRAIHRGQRRQEASAEAARARQMSEEEFRRLHSQYRLDLSEHIEECIRRLVCHFPGFQFETIFGERGWGAACYRDDFQIDRGQRSSGYSRLEITVRPYSEFHVVDLQAKGTIRNKEVFSRRHHEKLEDLDEDSFQNLIDVWVLEYAELYSASS
jgi:hypothetical protein